MENKIIIEKLGKETSILYSFPIDFNRGSSIKGVVVINPFKTSPNLKTGSKFVW